MLKTVLLLLLALGPLLCVSWSCGESARPVLPDKIVGGRDAAEGEFPWQASLHWKYEHQCGASLVSPYWLVTAAHCIQPNSNTTDYKIKIGSTILSQMTADEEYSVRQIVIKGGFDSRTLHNDIALVRLSRPVPDSVSPICLSEEPPPPNSTAVVTGWGHTFQGGKDSDYLQAVDVPIIPLEDCLKYYDGELTESMTCAGYEEGQKDSCQEDSGGPFQQWRGGLAYLVGVVSWGIGCAAPRHPGVYADVPQFVPWINHYIQGDGTLMNGDDCVNGPVACRAADTEPSCGKGVRPALPDKIVGGRDAAEGEFPWQASLHWKINEKYVHQCGASVVSPYWLVTAAHCMKWSSDTTDYMIKIGYNNLTHMTVDEEYSIRLIVIKEGFNFWTFHNDIALVQLSRPLPDSISPICLTRVPPPPNSRAVVTGWGHTKQGGKDSDYLQAVDVPIIPLADCLKYYDRPGELTESMTCAGYEEGQKDACKYDSGGPLQQWRAGLAYLVGVVSWGAGCAAPGLPGVYTDAPQFVPWINYWIGHQGAETITPSQLYEKDFLIMARRIPVSAAPQDM